MTTRISSSPTRKEHRTRVYLLCQFHLHGPRPSAAIRYCFRFHRLRRPVPVAESAGVKSPLGADMVVTAATEPRQTSGTTAGIRSPPAPDETESGRSRDEPSALPGIPHDAVLTRRSHGPGRPWLGDAILCNCALQWAIGHHRRPKQITGRFR